MRTLKGAGFLSDTSTPRTSWLDVYIPPDDQRQVLAAIGHAIQNREIFELEHRVIRADGAIGWTHSRAVPLMDANGEITEWFGAASDITARKEAEAELRDSRERLSLLTAHLIGAQEEERRRISRDLHDDLIQRMGLLISEIRGMEENFPGWPEESRRQLRSIAAKVNALTDDVRRTAYQLHPAILEHLGLVHALQALCSDFSRQAPVSVTFRHRRVPKYIPDNIALGLYRIGQESLRNVVVHSEAARASVTLGEIEGSLRLRVRDNGRGFDPTASTARRGLGLISMEERARAMHGTLSVESKPGRGTRVQALVPLSDEQNH
jgi:signal transduction histidine kinase